MKKDNRYKISHLTEDQFEPGSRGRVLRNKLGITSKREMDIIEKKELFRTLEELISLYDKDYRLKAADLKKYIECGSAVFMNGQVNIVT